MKRSLVILLSNWHKLKSPLDHYLMDLSDFNFSDLPVERPSSGLDSLTALFNKLLHDLPVNLDRFVIIAKNEPNRIFTEHIANRLIITLLNEQDLRISDKVQLTLYSIFIVTRSDFATFTFFS